LQITPPPIRDEVLPVKRQALHCSVYLHHNLSALVADVRQLAVGVQHAFEISCERNGPIVTSTGLQASPNAESGQTHPARCTYRARCRPCRYEHTSGRRRSEKGSTGRGEGGGDPSRWGTGGTHQGWDGLQVFHLFCGLGEAKEEVVGNPKHLKRADGRGA
jgi:hypothetical protein